MSARMLTPGESLTQPYPDDIMFYKNKKGEAVMRPPASLASPYESL